MKPPVDHVRISSKGKEILSRIKKRTSLQHWNEICRVAYCQSLAKHGASLAFAKTSDNAIDMDWKTFAGAYDRELTALTLHLAARDNIDINDKTALAIYFRSHLERGIAGLQQVKGLQDLLTLD
jgi:DNA sulfur modification protein DndE